MFADFLTPLKQKSTSFLSWNYAQEAIYSITSENVVNFQKFKQSSFLNKFSMVSTTAMPKESFIETLNSTTSS